MVKLYNVKTEIMDICPNQASFWSRMIYYSKFTKKPEILDCSIKNGNPSDGTWGRRIKKYLRNFFIFTTSEE